MLLSDLPKPPFSYPSASAPKPPEPDYRKDLQNFIARSASWRKILTRFAPAPEPESTLTPEERVALAAVPGNTAKSHGRPFSVWLFFNFKAQATDQAQKLGKFIYACRKAGFHPSLVEQLDQWDAYKLAKDTATAAGQAFDEESEIASKPFGSIMLTWRSLVILGGPMKESRYANFFVDAGPFRNGMMPDRDVLGDIEKPKETVEPGDPWHGHGFGKEFDIALFLAANTRKNCNGFAQLAVDLATTSDLAEEHREEGFNIQPGGPGTPIFEPFGFMDGISNLFFIKDDMRSLERLLLQRGVNAPPAWSPKGEWKNLLYESAFPPGTDAAAEMNGGSFVVLRKLEQDVEGFRSWENSQMKAGVANPGGRMVGRLRNGCPIAGLTASKLPNDFNYAQAPGSGCPFGAHIRKANPRGSSNPREDESLRLFVRRGMTYAPSDDYAPGDPAPSGTEIGLLFTGYMNHIDRQFISLNNRWLKDPKFPTGQQVGADLLSLPPKDKGFVTPRGGGYFFAPPIPWVNKFGP